MEYMTPNFTKDMVKTHKILIPNMAVTQFRLMQAALASEGYQTEVLGNCVLVVDDPLVEAGLGRLVLLQHSHRLADLLLADGLLTIQHPGQTGSFCLRLRLVVGGRRHHICFSFVQLFSPSKA